MRASLVMPCALAALTVGCGRGSPAAKQDGSVEASVATSVADAGPADAAIAIALEPASAPNMRYARLDRATCFAELGRRAIAFEEIVAIQPAWTSRRWAAKKASPRKPKPRPRSAAPPAPLPTHVLAPIRLRGPLHGVAIHSALPEKQRAKATIEIFDCRLVLALDDFAALLSEHGISEVVHMSAFRSDAERGCTTKHSGKQHCGALAVDVGLFRKSDGSTLEVERDFNGKLGTTTCTPGAGPTPATPAAKELWAIACDSARRGLFHVILTPNYNEEHRNHFHLEITPDVDWMIVH